MELFTSHFAAIRAAGLRITLHIAEVIFCLDLRDVLHSKCISQTPENTPEDTFKLLSFKPDRLGHATFLNDETQAILIRENMTIEICLTSNFL